MTTLPMDRVEVVVLRRDLEAVLRTLGAHRCLELTGGKVPLGNSEAPGKGLQDLRTALEMPDLPPQTLDPWITRNPGAERALVDQVTRYRQRREAWEHDGAETRQALAALDAFRGLGLSPGRIARLGKLNLLVGTLPAGGGPALAALGPGAALRPLTRPNLWAALVHREVLETWETRARTLGFSPLDLPGPEILGPADQTVDQRIADLEAHLVELETEGAALEADRAALARDLGTDLHKLLAGAAVDTQVEALASSRTATEFLALVEGWIPNRDLPGLVAALEEVTGGLVSLRSRAPTPGESPPTSLAPRLGTAGFEPMVANFGSPAYGAIDPTPFVAWSYILLFAVMFGDLGQGACIVFVGWLLGRGLPGFTGFRPMAAVFLKVGLASMAAGLVYGSVFSNEHLLVPLVRLVPVDQPGRLVAFFGFTLVLGVALNSLGLVIHLVDSLRARKWEQALVSKTGLAGALVFWYALGFALRLGLGGHPEPWDALGFGLPVATLVAGPPVARALGGQSPFEDGPGFFVASLFLETFETAAFYLSNTLSFLRVGAFALSHAALGLVVYTLADLVSQAFAGAWALGFLVIVVGNLLIVGLEGLVVAIQVLRLEYYEFFSKFFFEVGTPFRPFSFSYPPTVSQGGKP